MPQRRFPELIDGLRLSCSRFTLCLDRVQRWPNGVAVVFPTAVPQGLYALHAALRDGLERLDLPTESRAYRPHVTLARHAGDSAAPAQIAPVHWHIRGYALVQSRPVTREYAVLRRFG